MSMSRDVTIIAQRGYNQFRIGEQLEEKFLAYK
jgi:hypothetical protein